MLTVTNRGIFTPASYYTCIKSMNHRRSAKYCANFVGAPDVDALIYQLKGRFCKLILVISSCKQ